jgi:proliferating cell nuclear antigen
MEFELDDAKSFKQCVDAIVNLVDEGSFQASKEGLRLRMMDPSQIALVDLELPKEAFSKYRADDSSFVGLDLVDFSKILSRSRHNEKLAVSLEENKLLLEFSGESKRSFKVPLLDLGSTLAREPKVPFDAVVKMKGSAFKEMIGDASVLSAHVVLKADSDSFFVEAHGDSGDLNTETKKGKLVELKASGESRAMFPAEYLNNIVKACPEEEVLEISLKTDAPVKITYSIGKAKLAYFLAPRTESA